MKELMENWRKHITEEPVGTAPVDEIISHLEGLQDDLNGEIRSFQNFIADPNNRDRYANYEEQAYDRGSAEAKQEVIEKLNAIIEMIKGS